MTLNNTIIGTNSGSERFLNMPTIAGVRIEVEDFEEILESKVSEHMLINITNGLNIVNDNIAPIPRTYQITGYLGSWTVNSDLHVKINQTNGKFETSPTKKDGLNSYGKEVNVFENMSNLVKEQHDALVLAWKNIKMIWFIDQYKNAIPSAIKNLSFIYKGSVNNKIIINATIKEIVTFSGEISSPDSIQLSMVSATPIIPSIVIAPDQYGTSLGNESISSIAISSVSSTASVSNGTFSNAQGTVGANINSQISNSSTKSGYDLAKSIDKANAGAQKAIYKAYSPIVSNYLMNVLGPSVMDSAKIWLMSEAGKNLGIDSNAVLSKALSYSAPFTAPFLGAPTNFLGLSIPKLQSIYPSS